MFRSKRKGDRRLTGALRFVNPKHTKKTPLCVAAESEILREIKMTDPSGRSWVDSWTAGQLKGGIMNAMALLFVTTNCGCE